MPRFISIAKAALLASVSAREIQKKIDASQLAVTRGQIHVDDLLECYPGIRVEEADMLSLVTKIKEQSFATAAQKQHGEVTIASLQQELSKLRASTNYYREQSKKFEEIVIYVRDNLEELQQKTQDGQRIKGLIHWLEQHLSKIKHC